MKISQLCVMAAMAIVLSLGCKNAIKENEAVTSPAEEMNDKHTAQNSLDVAGTYYGVLPSASYPGISTLITLMEGDTYIKEQEYLESNEVPKTTKGNFTWVDGSTISLGGNAYFVGEGYLSLLDANGKKYVGEMAKKYDLRKTELESQLDSNEGYTLQQFTDEEDQVYNVIFNTNPDIPTALIQSDHVTKLLTQTQAWAKGAEYALNQTKLIVKDNKATLYLGEKMIVLTEK